MQFLYTNIDKNTFVVGIENFESVANFLFVSVDDGLGQPVNKKQAFKKREKLLEVRFKNHVGKGLKYGTRVGPIIIIWDPNTEQR